MLHSSQRRKTNFPSYKMHAKKMEKTCRIHTDLTEISKFFQFGNNRI